MRGGEKCLSELCRLFPGADLFTLFRSAGSVDPIIEDRRVVTSFLDRLPGVHRWYRSALPLFPLAVETFDLEGYDLVLSSSHCVAKGVLVPPHVPHVSYVHTPMRYAWDARGLYLERRSAPARAAAQIALHRLRAWDAASASRVTRYVANSRHVAGRIARYYGRASEVVPPPVDTEFFRGHAGPGSGYLLVSAYVPYKGIELAIEAFNRLGFPLTVVGPGTRHRRLRRLAGPTVRLRGWCSPNELRERYAACSAVVFPALEDAGIVPLEANAMGRPVIALGRGGVLETIVAANAERTPDRLRPVDALPAPATGVFFFERNAEAIARAVRFFEANRQLFGPAALRANALPFDRARFRERMHALIDDVLAGAHGRRVLDTPLPRS